MKLTTEKLAELVEALEVARCAIHEYVREKDAPVKCATMRVVTDKNLRQALAKITEVMGE